MNPIHRSIQRNTNIVRHHMVSQPKQIERTETKRDKIFIVGEQQYTNDINTLPKNDDYMCITKTKYTRHQKKRDRDIDEDNLNFYKNASNSTS